MKRLEHQQKEELRQFEEKVNIILLSLYQSIKLSPRAVRRIQTLRVGANVKVHFEPKDKKVKARWEKGQIKRPKTNRDQEKTCGLS